MQKPNFCEIFLNNFNNKKATDNTMGGYAEVFALQEVNLKIHVA
jgi:hypothetical protein